MIFLNAKRNETLGIEKRTATVTIGISFEYIDEDNNDAAYDEVNGFLPLRASARKTRHSWRWDPGRFSKNLTYKVLNKNY